MGFSKWTHLNNFTLNQFDPIVRPENAAPDHSVVLVERPAALQMEEFGKIIG